ncbi:hypothetical protein Pmar_PMAR028048, partial [Perkinsus marinus ATCC 50983]
IDERTQHTSRIRFLVDHVGRLVANRRFVSVMNTAGKDRERD